MNSDHELHMYWYLLQWQYWVARTCCGGAETTWTSLAVVVQAGQKSQTQYGWVTHLLRKYNLRYNFGAHVMLKYLLYKNRLPSTSVFSCLNNV